MVNNTEEKGLVKVNDSIFTKIRRFFMLKFGRKHDGFVEVENDDNNNEQKDDDICDIEKNKDINQNENLKEEETKTEEVYEAKEEIERKLMNYYESIRKCI